MLQSSERHRAASAQSPTMEHRWGTRVPCRLRVNISVQGRDLGTGRLRNVSMTGAFLETSVDLPQFMRLDLALLSDAARPQGEIQAAVVRVARSGVGVEWCEPAGGDICALLGCAERCSWRGSPAASVSLPTP